ncbi:hypothetical protein HP532_07195 [Pseudomonas sp. CrR25]|nr:hypothetical protein [Pseudomonas sp. CrR25]
MRVNLVGLFDTVAAIGGLSDGWDVNDDQNGDLQLHLAPDSAKRVIHLVAGDEYRHNYSLNSTHPNFAEIVLPGAHGDIGGNYPLEAEESYSSPGPSVTKWITAWPTRKARLGSRPAVPWTRGGNAA